MRAIGALLSDESHHDFKYTPWKQDGWTWTYVMIHPEKLKIKIEPDNLLINSCWTNSTQDDCTMPWAWRATIRPVEWPFFLLHLNVSMFSTSFNLGTILSSAGGWWWSEKTQVISNLVYLTWLASLLELFFSSQKADMETKESLPHFFFLFFPHHISTDLPAKYIYPKPHSLLPDSLCWVPVVSKYNRGREPAYIPDLSRTKEEIVWEKNFRFYCQSASAT